MASRLDGRAFAHLTAVPRHLLGTPDGAKAPPIQLHNVGSAELLGGLKALLADNASQRM